MPKYKAYVVTVGTETGVFAQWIDVKAVTDGVPGSSYQGYKDWSEAEAAFKKARGEGKTKIVKISPPNESSSAGRTASVNANGRNAQDDRPGARQSRPAQQDYDRRDPERGDTKNRSTLPRANVVTRGGSVQSPGARAARDAAIAEILEELRRERQEQGTRRRSTQLGRGGSFASSKSISGNRESTSTRTERPNPNLASAPPRAYGSRRTARGDAGPSEPSTSSSPPTGVTVLEHGTSASALSPRSMQSLSYWSDEPESPARSPMSISSEVTGSTFLSSADVRSDLSSPSSCGTRYFPEDYLSRTRAKRERASARLPEPAAVRSPASVASEVPVTPNPRADELSMLFAPHEPMQSFASLATVRPPTTPAQAQAHTLPVSAPPAVRSQASQTAKMYDRAGVQDDRHTARSGRTDATVQTVEHRRYASAEIQTSPTFVLETLPTARTGLVASHSGESTPAERHAFCSELRIAHHGVDALRIPTLPSVRDVDVRRETLVAGTVAADAVPQVVLAHVPRAESQSIAKRISRVRSVCRFKRKS
ncbi:hypothetical protein C8Q73DRAFT_790274 [Cubamyces lactineus]|nr:hypothetical protein C8Q73DRAFT_790274 [Cubamyces lactineus]